jgi:hypothetical protein
MICRNLSFPTRTDLVRFPPARLSSASRPPGIRRASLAGALQALSLLAVFAFTIPPAQAQVIHRIDTAGSQRVLPLGSSVNFRIEFREVPETPWCGFAVDFGDGVIREFRAGAGGVLDFPLILRYAYASEGDYTVRVSGKMVAMGGLLPIQACKGDSPYVRIRIQDEKKREDEARQLRDRFDVIDARLSRYDSVVQQDQRREQQWQARLNEFEARVARQATVIEQQQRLIDTLQRRSETQPFPLGLVVEIQALREQVRQAQRDLGEARQAQVAASGASDQRLQALDQRQVAIDSRQRLLEERVLLLSERQRLLEGRGGGAPPAVQASPVR